MVSTAAFSYEYSPAMFINELTTILVFEQSSLTRNGQLEEFVFIFQYEGLDRIQSQR